MASSKHSTADPELRACSWLGYVHYPLLPWLGSMALGYAAGRLFLLPEAQRRVRMLALGIAACLLFVLLRGWNGYGDPRPWSVQSSSWMTLLSFLNVTKYPPSLAYLSMTLGPILLAVVAFERWRGPVAGALRTLGEVPLFAYVLHLMLVHTLAGLLGALSGHGTTMLSKMFMAYPHDWGVSLEGVYVAWALVLALLYPACSWFANLKRTHRRWWLAYL